MWIGFVEGFKEAADKFQKESGVQPMVDLEQLDERIKIREAIQDGRIQDAISLVNGIKPELLDNDRYLYFRLQVWNSYLKPFWYMYFKWYLLIPSALFNNHYIVIDLWYEITESVITNTTFNNKFFPFSQR